MVEHLTLIPIDVLDWQHAGKSRRVTVVMSHVVAVVYPSDTQAPKNGCVVMSNGVMYEFSEPTGADAFIKHLA